MAIATFVSRADYSSDWLKERINLSNHHGEGDSLSLEEITDEELFAFCELLLNAEGDNTSSISVPISASKRELDNCSFNGDGVITVEAGESEKIKSLFSNHKIGSWSFRQNGRGGRSPRFFGKFIAPKGWSGSRS